MPTSSLAPVLEPLRSGQSMTEKQRRQLENFVSPALEVTAEQTDSDYVLLSVLVDDELAVKVARPNKSFVSHDALAVPTTLDPPLDSPYETHHSTGRRSFPNGYTSTGQSSLTDKQRRFNGAIREKAWFNVFFRDQDQIVRGIVCLLRLDVPARATVARYDFEDLLNAWFRLQHCLSHDLAKAKTNELLHVGFVNATDSLSQLWAHTDWRDFWSGVVKNLTDAGGMQWDFACILETENDRVRCIANQASCEHDEWSVIGQLVKHLERQEVWAECQAQYKFAIQADRSGLRDAEYSIIPAALGLGADTHHHRPEWMTNRIIEFGQLWNDNLRGSGWQSEEPLPLSLYALAIAVADKTLVVFLGHHFHSSRVISQTLTTLYCEWTAKAFAQWYSATRREDSGPLNNEEKRALADSVLATLSADLAK